MVPLCMALVFQAAAQSHPLPKGGLDLNAGVGLGGWGVPIYIGLDYGLMEDITLGGEFAFRGYNDGPWKHNILVFAVNGNYHFNRILNIPPVWDFYAGLSLGFASWSHPRGYDEGRYRSGSFLGAQIGGRYYLTNNLALNLEAGGGTVNGGKFGITVKF